MSEQLTRLMEDEKFLKDLVTVETPEALATLFEAKGVTLEEGLSIEKAFELVKSSESAELNEEDLETATGGIGLLVGIGAAVSLGLSSGAICFLAGYGYQKIKNALKK